MTSPEERKAMEAAPTEIELAELARAMTDAGITPAGMLIYRRLCFAYNRAADAAGVNPMAMALSKERRDQLQRIIAQLSEDHRSVVTLRMIDGLSVKVTAKIMGKTEGAVKMLLMRSLKTLGPAIKAAPYFADFKHEEEVAGYEGE